MWRIGLAIMASVLGVTMACTQDQPCDRYVDYMCACHDGEQGFDCAELAETYSSADAQVQNECALELKDQREKDDDEGLDCDT